MLWYPAISSLFQTLSTHFSAYFPPKNDIFTYFKKESSFGSAHKLVGPLKTVPGEPMVATIRWPAISSLFLTLSTPFLDIFPPKNDIFTYFKKESISGSAKKPVSPLETVSGEHMVTTIKYPAYSEPFPPTFQPIFHPKLTFSPI